MPFINKHPFSHGQIRSVRPGPRSRRLVLAATVLGLLLFPVLTSAQVPPRFYWKNLKGGQAVPLIYQSLSGNVNPFDPAYVVAVERDQERNPRPYFFLPPPMESPHLWVGKLPAHPRSGTHAIIVRSEDMYGQVFVARRLIRID